MRFMASLSVMLLATALALPARADSLFIAPDAGSDPAATGLYAKHPPKLAEGDTVRIRLREKSAADVQIGVNTKDETKQDSTLDRTGGILGRLLNPFLKLIGEGVNKGNSKGEFKGDGSTDRTVRLDSIVTALVVGVLDNGNLLVEGRKKVLVNGESQTLVVRGTLNPKDLDKDLVADSERIADVEIEYVGEGQLSKKSRPGFLSKLIDEVF